MINSELFGGKGKSLCKLKGNGFPVPDFFVIPFEEALPFIEYNHINIHDHYEKVQKDIISGSFPKDLEESIMERFSKLKSKKVAVRSSAADEDGSDKSFAGQYDSFLFIEKDGLLSAVKKCWASYYNENAIHYRNSKSDSFLMSVIVQTMIDADIAGVGFSFNPSARDDNYYYFECCKGTGDLLVSGNITPTHYTVRRETLDVDFVEGDEILTEQQVKDVTKLILDIETLYKCPIDLEWCIYHNNLYVVQARPLTAYQIKTGLIKNIITRNKRLWQIECYCAGEYTSIKELTTGLYYQNPILYFISPQKTKIYYSFEKLEEHPGLIFRYLDKNYERFLTYFNNAEKACQDILKSIEDGTWTFEYLYNKITIIYPFETLGNIAGRDFDISDRVREKLYYFREHYDSVYYKCEEAINNYLDTEMPDYLQKYISVLSKDEILDISKVNIDILEKRLNGFVYFEGKMNFLSFEDFCKENYFYIEEVQNTSDNVIKGDIVYTGKVKGYAKVIYAKEDFAKFNDGDIIVSSMTTPKFLSILKRSVGFITDEGGVTCHAAIVSRELKKPCLINCGNATSIIHDGDYIELDSYKGIVTILEKNKDC